MTILSGLPDHLVEHVRGLGHLGGVENQVDVVVLRGDRGLERERETRLSKKEEEEEETAFGLNLNFFPCWLLSAILLFENIFLH